MGGGEPSEKNLIRKVKVLEWKETLTHWSLLISELKTKETTELEDTPRPQPFFFLTRVKHLKIALCHALCF